MITTKTHPTEIELAGFLSNSLSAKDRRRVEDHLVLCNECLEKTVSAYESVKLFGGNEKIKKRRFALMKKINPYLALACLTFLLSFITPRYFIQSLVATLILGIKWVVDSKTTKMLIMIHEAWKRGGERDVSRIMHTFDYDSKNRL